MFCGSCGAPQVRLSEELREQAQRQLARESGAGAELAASALPPDAGLIVWKSVIRYAAVAAAVFSFFAVLLPPLALAVPPVVLGLYAARHKASRINAGVGATVGLLCGLFMAIGMALLNAAGLLVLRFGVQGMAQFDSNVDATLLRVKEQLMAQGGPASAEFANSAFNVPEFRVGMFLAGMAMLLFMLLLLSVLTGSIAGYLRAAAGRR